MNMAPAPELLGFMSVQLWILFVFTFFFNCLVVPQVEWKMKYVHQIHKTKGTHQAYLSKLIWYLL